MRVSAVRRWLRERRAAQNAHFHELDLALARQSIAEQENQRQVAGDTRWFGTTDDGVGFEWVPGRGCRTVN